MTASNAFFWTGDGLVSTRTSTWGNRIQKLFEVAKVEGTPYVFRHTLARDFLEDGGSMAELTEPLGNSTRDISLR